MNTINKKNKIMSYNKYINCEKIVFIMYLKQCFPTWGREHIAGKA